MQNYEFKDFDKLLRFNGYERDRQKGSHVTYKNNTGRIITITNRSAGVNACLGRKLIKEYNLNTDNHRVFAIK